MSPGTGALWSQSDNASGSRTHTGAHLGRRPLLHDKAYQLTHLRVVPQDQLLNLCLVLLQEGECLHLDPVSRACQGLIQ